MPIYDYVCRTCGHRLEVIHGVDDEGPRYCPACGAESTMRKAFVPPAIVFKGGGWAKKDRRATRAPAASTGERSSSEGGDRTSSSEVGSGEPAPSASGDGPKVKPPSATGKD